MPTVRRAVSRRRPVVCLLLAGLAVLAGCTDQRGEAQPEATSQGSVPEAVTSTFSGSWDEWAQLIIGCMAEQGWVVELGDPADGQSLDAPSVTARQRTAFGAAMDDCESRVGALPPPEILSAEEISAEYNRQLAVAACLTEAGYPTAPAPSREAFVADYYQPDGVHWDAYSVVLDTLSRQDYLDAAALCPRFP